MRPYTIREHADEAEIEPRHVLAMAREHGVRMVDFKFTDLPGTWQHVSLSIQGLKEDASRRASGSTARRSAASRRSRSRT